MSNTVIHIYTIEKPEWSSVTNNQKNNIVEIITRGGWRQIDGLRRGFLNCSREDNVLYGYFAQEGRIRVEQYDDEQRPLSDEQESFERILFLLFLDAGILAVQSVRIPRYIDLTGSELRESFFKFLELTFRQAGIVFQNDAEFERYKEELTREELIRIFEEHHIRRIIVRDLVNSHVPTELKLFNPDFDADAFLKSVINEDLENTEESQWIGENVQETKIARALVHAGNPILIEGIDENGQIRAWTPSTPQKIDIDLDTNDVHFPEEDFQRLTNLIRITFGSFTKRIQELDSRSDTSDLPLFEGRQE